MKDIDVLIVARPDHSMQIYNALLKQDRLSFLFLSYKVFPVWIKKMFGIKKMTTVSKNAICSWKLTIVNLCRYKFRFPFAQNWDETLIFDRHLRRIFKNKRVRIIHYWPEYGDYEIIKYVKSHPGTLAFADIHMPHPKSVYEDMKSVYLKYGIEPESMQLFNMAQNQADFVNNANDILVPSSYVADSYKRIYKDKRYHIISYGITVSSSYTKRHRTIVKEFVYAGRISLEKGSDLLLDFFERNPELNIHLYGSIVNGQEFIFDKYKGIPNIYFHGLVPKVELQNRLKLYDVGIHLSRFDAYSLAVGEMIGTGLPVIVSEAVGNKDDIKAENFGLVTSLEVKCIEDTIRQMCKLDLYNKFVDNIEDYIRYRHVSYGEKLINFYLNTIAS
ncbi:Glycosyltransferase involved in cell wall bisynthesis [Xylanibacter ruminicola]|uniref:Glycosyltransferase involved in cell wall bisynthesis n=1 Tax=Xylanibacter ruminicola TaxID=839 RepID=A0A1H4C425_XYLRU|nr:glycosyltransferase [Xylanibacter ruminicola]SEA55205.1 Glycosyltransferase involved in cell wall bisynthesis [Xylanibacter ruminicola]